MNPNIIIILCAANLCVHQTGAATESISPPKEYLTASKTKTFPQCKMNIEGFLINEREEKRRPTTVIKRKDKYGYRTASPCKATLRRRNKKR